MAKPKIIPLKVKHRYTLTDDGDPVAFCSTEPYMNYQLPKQPKLVREWKDCTCGYCHHALSLGRRPRDRMLKAVQ